MVNPVTYEYYKNWMNEHPERKILSVSDILQKQPGDRHYNHLIGILKKTNCVKYFKRITPKSIYDSMKARGREIQKEYNIKFRFIILKDTKGEDTVCVRVKKGEAGELLNKETEGQKIVLFFNNISQKRRIITPIYYEITFDEGEINDSELSYLKRQRYRLRTLPLYERVKRIYNYKCAKCKKKKKLEIHHINYNEENTDEEMLRSMIPLCRKCHSQYTTEQIHGQKFKTLDNFY